MSGLAAAIRLRRRQLDALAMTLAAEQAAGQALARETRDLERHRAAERQLVSAAPFSCDPWFDHGARRLEAIADARARSDRALADLRDQAVQARARLQLLEDAADAAASALRRRRDAKAAAALDDRIAAGWSRR
ncbi:hypothetical protein GGQ97_000234 [Sphingomonas kaistensis]|uniref:Uncharacterized protein n=1 Tax=Sphingomonas kaistensis TaxID=298708 RepID=A0A7X5Y3E6_9SPHN|nr:hypothetical protein [Sphingomonas kaistensis]NJC04441.1 hypothetical protein [Sphingomonas kaistensis]